MTHQPHPASWQSFRFRAMGSQIALWLDCADIKRAAAAFEQVKALFEQNERALSRFLPESELMQLNRRAGQWVTASDLLWRELVLAVEMARETNGRFDPTLLNALTHAGYDRPFAEIVGMGNGRWQVPGSFAGRWRAIELDFKRQAVCLPAGVQLDLGGIAKGDTAQQTLVLLDAVGPGLIDAGGDLVAGRPPVGFPGWPVSLSPPWGDGLVAPEQLAAFWLSQGALASSGVDYRRWRQNGSVAHHLIDPRTGQPAQTDLLTATVFAPRAAVAEAWATATLIAGSAAGMQQLLAHELAGVMVLQDGRILATEKMDQLLQSG